MFQHIDGYGRVSAHVGIIKSQTLTAGSLSGYASSVSRRNVIEMPIRKGPTERVSSLIVHPRSANSTYTGNLFLYGCVDGKIASQAAWYGPIAVKQFTTADYPGPTNKVVAGSTGTYKCAPSVQFDTQDFPHVALLVQLSSTPAGWAGRCGVCFDVDVQDATA